MCQCVGNLLPHAPRSEPLPSLKPLCGREQAEAARIRPERVPCAEIPARMYRWPGRLFSVLTSSPHINLKVSWTRKHTALRRAFCGSVLLLRIWLISNDGTKMTGRTGFNISTLSFSKRKQKLLRKRTKELSVGIIEYCSYVKTAKGNETKLSYTE